MALLYVSPGFRKFWCWSLKLQNLLWKHLQSVSRFVPDIHLGMPNHVGEAFRKALSRIYLPKVCWMGVSSYLNYSLCETDLKCLRWSCLKSLEKWIFAIGSLGLPTARSRTSRGAPACAINKPLFSPIGIPLEYHCQPHHVTFIPPKYPVTFAFLWRLFSHSWLRLDRLLFVAPKHTCDK